MVSCQRLLTVSFANIACLISLPKLIRLALLHFRTCTVVTDHLPVSATPSRLQLSVYNLSNIFRHLVPLPVNHFSRPRWTHHQTSNNDIFLKLVTAPSAVIFARSVRQNASVAIRMILVDVVFRCR